MKNLDLSIKLLILWYLFIFLSIELLSLIKGVTRVNILISDILFFITIFLFWGKELVLKIKSVKHISWTNLLIISFLVITFIQGFFSAPNTTDSMVYHLPRIIHWLQEKTVFQTAIYTAHDFMPPFAEYILVHLYALVNSDRLLFLSQWFAYLFSIVLSGLIAQQLGADTKIKNLTRLFFTVLPIAVMQAASTQTDMLVVLITFLSINLVLNFYKDLNIRKSILLGFVLGLGMLVKANFIIFSIIPLGLLVFLTIKKAKKLFPLVFLVVLVCGLIQTRFFYQNIQLFGSPLGETVFGGDGGFTNEMFTLPTVLSNSVRNLMVNVPVPIFSHQVQNIIIGFHKIIGLDINDLRTTRVGNFQVPQVLYPQEDITGNPLHLFLIALAGLYLFRKKTKFNKIGTTRMLYLLVVFSFILFSLILRWQSFIIRLEMPLFAVGTVVAVVILSKYKNALKLLNLFLVISIPLSFFLIILNVSRPYISYNRFYSLIRSFTPPNYPIPQSFFIKPRVQQYFNSRWYWYEPYSSTAELLAQNKNNQIISLKLMDVFEYPFLVLLKEKGIKFQLTPLDWQNKEVNIITTSTSPFIKKGYDTTCFKTQIDYGYMCLSSYNGDI